MKRCTACGRDLPEDCFYRKPNGLPMSQCKACKRAYQIAHRARLGPEEMSARKRVWNRNSYERTTRPYRLMKRYGLTVEQYDEMLERQGGVCAICGVRPDEQNHLARNGEQLTLLAVDHDHETGAVRGLLCVGCNKGIGNLRDDADLVFAAWRYLAGVIPNREGVSR